MEKLNDYELEKVSGGAMREENITDGEGEGAKYNYVCFDCKHSWKSDTPSVECPDCHSKKLGMCQ